MVLATMAVYIFMFAFILYLSYRAFWVVFFLFSFRFWHMIFYKYFPETIETLTGFQEFLLLFILAFITYLSVILTTLRMPLLRYVFLAILIIAAIRVYSLQDILLFKDYLEENGMWNIDYWTKQIRDVFTLNPKEILGIFEKALESFVDFFKKMIDIIRSI